MSALTEIPFAAMDGGSHTLSEYSGKVVLLVNVASKCGFTPQYEGLQALYADQHDAGLEIVAFPANNFGAQEPGTNDEIREFCSTTYNVTFPVMAKISVAGDDRHPLYAALTAAIPTVAGSEQMREGLRGHGITTTEGADVVWNFEKFLIGKDGTVVGRYPSAVAPNDPELRAAIDTELAK
jgi:glutathione peroxidase